MPPKASSRANTPRAPTPARTGLRSQQQAASPLHAAVQAQAELPTIQSQSTNAYGGPSRVAIASETRAATGTDDVANTFGATLTSALARTDDLPADSSAPASRGTEAARNRPTRRSSSARADSEELSDGGATRVTRSKKSRAAILAAMPPIAEDSNSATSTAIHATGHDTTHLDNSRAGAFATPSRLATPTRPEPSSDDVYKADPIASFQSQNAPPAQRHRREPRQVASHGQNDVPLQNADEPAHARFELPKLDKKSALLILAALLFVIFPGLLALPKYFPNAPIGTELMSQLDAAQYLMSSYLPRFGRFTFKNGSPYPWALDSRVGTLETQMSMVIKNLNLHEITLKSLKDSLPDRIAVRRTNDGELHVTDAFWHAIQARIDRRDENAWQEFLEANRQKINEYLDARTTLQSDKNHQAWKAENAWVTEDQFLTLVNEKYASLRGEISQHAASYNSKLFALEKGLIDAAIESTSNALDKAIKALPDLQLSTLAGVNLVQNTEVHLKKVNFFAPSLGAVVNPYKSSPTATRRTINLPHRSFFQVFKGFVPNPHIMALEPWSEPRDCWCAAPPPKREVDEDDPSTWPSFFTASKEERAVVSPRLQLTVELPQAIYPKEVTIEHFPKEGNLDSSSTPKDLELWAAVPNEVDRAKLLGDAHWIFKEDQEDLKARIKGEPLDLGDSWVKIAMFRYDQASPNHIQTFPVGVSALKHGVGIRTLALRAISNYGGDATCLYRARLHGSITPPVNE